MSSGSVGNMGTAVTRRYVRLKNGSVSLNATLSKTVSDTRQIWSGGEIPHFHKRRKAGELLPFNSYKKFEAISLTNNCDWTTRYVSGSTVDTLTYYDNGYNGLMPYLTETDLDNMLGYFDAKPMVQAAAAKIASSGFDLLTFVVELRGVHDLWRNAGRDLLKLLRRTKGSAVNSWLQYRYGWRCLYFDLRNIQKLITSLDEKRVRIKERVGRDYTRTEITRFTNQWASATVSWSYEDRITCGVRGLVCADIDVPPIQINPFVTAWELTKYSFVIDWWLQIGQWINTMTFLSASSQHFAAGSYALTCERTLYLDSVQMNTGYSYPTLTLDQSHIATLKVRVPTSIPLGIQTTLKLDAFKVGDLIAMLLQILRR